MAATRIGTWIDCTAQTVELFDEQSSIPSTALVERVAFADRNDLKVKTFVPVSNCRLVLALIGSATATLLTICVTIVPSFLSSLRGCLVLINSVISGSIATSFPFPPAPAAG